MAGFEDCAVFPLCDRWKKAYPVHTPNAVAGAASHGQDKWLISAFRGLSGSGSFVEFGAEGGIEGTNTYLLEKCSNWTGVCVASSSAAFEQLKLSNRRCTRVLMRSPRLDLALQLIPNDVELRYIRLGQQQPTQEIELMLRNLTVAVVSLQLTTDSKISAQLQLSSWAALMSRVGLFLMTFADAVGRTPHHNPVGGFEAALFGNEVFFFRSRAPPSTCNKVSSTNGLQWHRGVFASVNEVQKNLIFSARTTFDVPDRQSLLKLLADSTRRCKPKHSGRKLAINPDSDPAGCVYHDDVFTHFEPVKDRPVRESLCGILGCGLDFVGSVVARDMDRSDIGFKVNSNFMSGLSYLAL